MNKCIFIEFLFIPLKPNDEKSKGTYQPVIAMAFGVPLLFFYACLCAATSACEGGERRYHLCRSAARPLCICADEVQEQTTGTVLLAHRARREEDAALCPHDTRRHGVC